MEFSPLELDGLREVVNIGGGHAATSIGELTGKLIEMDIPDIKILDYNGVYEEVTSADSEVYAVYNRVEGQLDGAFLFTVSHETATLLAKLMTGSNEINDELKESALNELGNIVSNSFLRAIGDLIGFQVQASLPTLLNDVFGAVLTSTYMELEQYDEQILVIRNEFKYVKQHLDASLFFIPSTGNLEKIFDALGI